jgi:hypothetical protein
MLSLEREGHLDALRSAIKQNEQALTLMRSLLEDVERRRAQSAQKHPPAESANRSDNPVESTSMAA